MSATRPDVVFDCNVFLQSASRSTGPAAQAFRLVEQNQVTLHVSKPILREVRRALSYPELRERNPQLTDSIIDEFLRRVLFRGVLHRNVPRVFHFSRDPDDEAYVDLAVAVSADYLVTRDRDLLSLATDHSPEAKQFRQLLPQLSVVDPVTFAGLIKTANP